MHVSLMPNMFAIHRRQVRYAHLCLYDLCVSAQTAPEVHMPHMYMLVHA